MKNFQYILIAVLVLVFNQSFAQDREFPVKFVAEDSLNTELANLLNKYDGYRVDNVVVNDSLNKIIEDLRLNGFIASSIDSVLFDSTQIIVKIYIGQHYKINNLEITGMNLDAGKIRGLNKTQSKNKTYEFAELQDIKQQIVTYFENNGYPFASISVDHCSVDEQHVSLKLNVEKGNYFVLDTMILKGEAKIKPYYINRYIGLKPGDAFSQATINTIDARINDLLFLNTIKPAELEFRDKQAILYVYLKNKKANQFNGIIGFIPESEKSDKMVVTGDLQLFLVNSFSRGEEIGLRWEKLESETQKLDVKFQYPYLFKSPFGLDMSFNLYKQDTSFLNTNYTAGIRWYASTKNHIRVFYQYKSSSVIDGFLFTSTFADMRSSLFGASWNYSALNYRFNPRRGIDFSLSGGAGAKETKNFVIPDSSKVLDYTSLEAELIFDAYYPVYGNFVFHFGHITKYMNQFDNQGSQSVFYENEMHHFGGARSLRGFDENAFAASIYSFQNIELRYLFEQNSAFYVFWNGAYYYKPMPEKTTEDFPWGIGIGLNFDTRAGIFSISYATGRQFDNPIEIQAAKIHVGYISRF
ncbi:MAG: POTRA domain-containing protein [Bacteroidales bacterium]|nr:POTRA domain-containing protein [Bacteroidales bacterium]